MTDLVVSERTFVISTGKRTLTGEIDPAGEPITRPETRTLPACVPFASGLLDPADRDSYLADGMIVDANSAEGRRIVGGSR